MPVLTGNAAPPGTSQRAIQRQSKRNPCSAKATSEAPRFGMPFTPHQTPPEQDGNKHAKTHQVVIRSKNDDDSSIWRDTALRYGGYADEVGEFLTPYLGGLGKFLGYGISSVYCGADMATTIPKKYQNAPEDMPTTKKAAKTAAEAADLSMFHLVATLLIPPKIIGAAVEFANHSLDSEQLKEHGEALTKEKSAVKGFLHKGAKFFNESLGLKNYTDGVEKRFGKDDGWIAKSLKPKVEKLVEKQGENLGRFVDINKTMAEGYNKVMPISYFKVDELVETLGKNAKSLKSGNIIKESLKAPDLAKLLMVKPLPVLVGISMVPLIAHPFDQLMLKIQDWTIRPLIGKNKIVKDANGKHHSIHNPTFWGKVVQRPVEKPKHHHHIRNPFHLPHKKPAVAPTGMATFPTTPAVYPTPLMTSPSPFGFQSQPLPLMAPPAANGFYLR